MADRKAVVNAVSGQPQKSIEDFDPPRRPKKNIFAIACAVLASTTFIVLGYGQFSYYISTLYMLQLIHYVFPVA